jgi:hypothetical protein
MRRAAVVDRDHAPSRGKRRSGPACQPDPCAQGSGFESGSQGKSWLNQYQRRQLSNTD